MTHNEKTRTLILEHYKKYPMMEIADLFKFLFQSSFGCEHMVSSLEGAIEYIKRESATVSDEKADGELIDRLDGDYVRVHLGYLKHGIDADTLGKLFYLSAKTEADGKGFLIGPFCFGKEYIFKLSGILNKNEVSVFHAKDVIEDIILSGFEEKFF